jgi:hypothetical protein
MVMRGGANIGWGELLAKHRTIILAEAGAGKTTEIRQATLKLRGQNKYAFFMRLENVVGGIEDAFEEGDLSEFQVWLASKEPAWLLLDSVDEARLQNPKHFEKAINIIARHLQPALQRVHIVITSRAHAWRRTTDLLLCGRKLPFNPPTDKVQHGIVEPLSPDSATNPQEPNGDNEISETFQVYSINDLTVAQVKLFLVETGFRQADQILADIERHDAWVYARRPQDLEEMIAFLESNGKIGSRFELVEHNINQRLKERDEDRTFYAEITTSLILTGAKQLAAATTLLHQSEIRIADGAMLHDGLDVKSVLTNWTANNCATLLSRPVFDEAIYGTVRFHHRSSREFLTAQWLADLLRIPGGRRAVANLIFREQYGQQVITPTLKPVLSWLVLLDNPIMEKVCTIEPAIVFECGDPSRLPLTKRIEVLRSVCKNIYAGLAEQRQHDYTAIQRFSNPDLATEIQSLLTKYETNDNVVLFLFRMIWQGQIKQALPMVKQYAVNNQVNNYVRTAAAQNIAELGDKKDFDDVLNACLCGESNLVISRDFISVLIEHLEPTANAIHWLFNILKKIDDKRSYDHDTLIDVLIKFINTLSLELLEVFILKTASKLADKPFKEEKYCNISNRYCWLFPCGIAAITIFIRAKHSFALTNASLGVLAKLPALKKTLSNDNTIGLAELTTLIHAWPQLKYKLFWHTVAETKSSVFFGPKKRLTGIWQASTLRRYFQFTHDDFNHVQGCMIQQGNRDDRLVALSVAFEIYRDNGRPRKWREQLKKIAKKESALEEQLYILMHPPAQTADDKKWKKIELKYERESEKRKKQDQEYHANWYLWLQNNYEQLRNVEFLSELANGGNISGAQQYLLGQMRETAKDSSTLGKGNWQDLIPVFGLNVATAFKDGVVAYWRWYAPGISAKDGNSQTIPYAVILGLCGLIIESVETPDWPANLTKAEAKLVCQYSLKEINSFPDWFAALYEKFPVVVSKFVIKEIKWELEAAELGITMIHMLDKFNREHQALKNDIAPVLLPLLNQEPANLDCLVHSLNIIQSCLDIPDKAIAALAGKKCEVIKAQDRLAFWFAIWIGTETVMAIANLHMKLNQLSKQDANLFAMQVIDELGVGNRFKTLTTRQAFKGTVVLPELCRLMYKHINPAEDVDSYHEGSHRKGLRENAQAARNNLFSLLKDTAGKNTYLTMLELANMHPKSVDRTTMLESARQRAEKDADIKPWTTSQFLEFEKNLESAPKNHTELFNLTHQRLFDLKLDLEEGDYSIASILKKEERDDSITSILIEEKSETKMRNYIGWWLREKANGKYSVAQEEELADAKRPDIRIHGCGFDSPVPIELKMAEHWSGNVLMERLQNQLCGDYLRDSRSSLGIFLLVYRGAKDKAYWHLNGPSNKVNFDQLIPALQRHWLTISADFPNVADIRVIGIDLTKRN